MKEFDRISRDPRITGGKPTIGVIVGQIGAGVTIDELRYAARLASERDVAFAIQ